MKVPSALLLLAIVPAIPLSFVVNFIFPAYVLARVVQDLTNFGHTTKPMLGPCVNTTLMIFILYTKPMTRDFTWGIPLRVH